jgi:hypothetical protein
MFFSFPLFALRGGAHVQRHDRSPSTLPNNFELGGNVAYGILHMVVTHRNLFEIIVNYIYSSKERDFLLELKCESCYIEHRKRCRR